MEETVPLVMALHLPWHHFLYGASRQSRRSQYGLYWYFLGPRNRYIYQSKVWCLVEPRLRIMGMHIKANKGRAWTAVVLFCIVSVAGCGDVEWFPEAQSPLAAPEIITKTQVAATTAICCDGDFSQSQSCSGTCAQHGGVEQWLIPGMGCNEPTACGAK